MSRVFSPMTLRDLQLPHRAWVSPMCMYACEARDGMVGDFHVAHYGQYALGGAALILTEATAVVPEGRVTAQDAGIWSDAHIAAWERVTATVHLLGGRIAVQLGHAGRKGSKRRGLPGDAEPAGPLRPADGGWQLHGATGEPFGRYDPPLPAASVYLAALPDAFASAAERAVRAGFDAVELHTAHGYLVHEMLSPATNPRSDAWGADPAGRERLLFETVAAVRATIPDGMPLLVRISTSDVVEGGRTPADSAELAPRLWRPGSI